MKGKLTQNELKKHLHYDPDTGLFTWLVKSNSHVNIGDVAGSLSSVDGYIRIGINGKGYLAHRLACLYMEGYLPEYEVDHKFGIRHDNRWTELLHVTKSCNLQNQKIRKDNTSGFPGVSWYKWTKTWVSNIKIDKKRINLGYYNTPLDAALARFTFEVWCDKWKCNYRSELVKAIKDIWPEFNTK
jgi:hypothetical protein